MRAQRQAGAQRERFGGVKTVLSATAFGLALVGGLLPARRARAEGWCCENCDEHWEVEKCHYGSKVRYCGFCVEWNGYVNSTDAGDCDPDTYDDPPGAPDCGQPPPPENPCTSGEAEFQCTIWCQSYCSENGYSRIEDCRLEQCTADDYGNWNGICAVTCGS